MLASHGSQNRICYGKEGEKDCQKQLKILKLVMKVKIESAMERRENKLQRRVSEGMLARYTV